MSKMTKKNVAQEDPKKVAEEKAARDSARRKLRDAKQELEQVRKILLLLNELSGATYLHKAIAEIAKTTRAL